MVIYQSDIPQEAEEKFISPYRSEFSCDENGCGGAVWLERREYWLDGELRGTRFFEKDGTLSLEHPFWDGKHHGTSYRWHENGQLDYVESHRHGILHGKTYQYSETGELMGASELVNGTGYAAWWHRRHELENPGYYLSEVYYLKDNLMQGYEWWINEGQKSLYIEVHYWKGDLHGIERRWNADGLLYEGYPKYYIMNKEVGQTTYIEASHEDPRLPKYKESDQSFYRDFPEDIKRIMRGEIVK